VLVVAHYATEQRGGEGSIPLRLFGRLNARGLDCRLVTHDLFADELASSLPPDQFRRVTFVPSLRGFGTLQRVRPQLPAGLRTMAWGLTQLERQIAMVPVVRGLVREYGIDVVHQPISVSPVVPSPMVRLGAPVVMGPLNGGMDLPGAFSGRDSRAYALTKRARPALSRVLHHCWRGRLEAEVILVANERTAHFLPPAARTRVEMLSDIGVVLGDWPLVERPVPRITRYLFLGRLIGWKGVDLLLDAFAPVARQLPARLDIGGDGPERSRLEAQARRLGLVGHVRFHGWLSQTHCAELIRDCDVFVSPTLQEAGGVAVLEAMATGRPVIAAKWGGTATTVTPETGIPVGVETPEGFRQGLTAAMLRLARDPQLRQRLGAEGRRRVEVDYDWDVLTERLIAIYRRTIGSTGDHTGPSAIINAHRDDQRAAGSAPHRLDGPGAVVDGAKVIVTSGKDADAVRHCTPSRHLRGDDSRVGLPGGGTFSRTIRQEAT
jgi:glycosyltransferase involved in cell wall biosynthesis